MPKRRKWLIWGGASFLAPTAQRRVERYVPATPDDVPAAGQRRRLSDRLEALLGDAARGADQAAS